MTEIVVRAEGLTRRLEAEVPVTLVENIDLEIRRGEFLAVSGPSGSGKSSLLYLLGLLDRPTSGKLWLDGVETSSFSENRLADVRLAELGFVFQSHFLLPEFTVVENVMLPIQRLGRLERAAAEARATQLLCDLEMQDQLHKLPRQLSGGQSQRVAIARSLANDPPVILADEPTGNLDTKSSAIVQKIMKDLAHTQNRAVVIVTHDSRFAAEADRRVTIVDGRLAAGLASRT